MHAIMIAFYASQTKINYESKFNNYAGQLYTVSTGMISPTTVFEVRKFWVKFLG